jgi:glycosyltransferase involved in cell wall biosynthesis
MKVLHVIPAISGGGIERMLLSQYSKPLAALGSDIFTLSPVVSSQGEDFKSRGFKISFPSQKGRLAVIRSFQKTLSSKTFDIVHVHLNETSWVILFFLWIFRFQGLQLVHSHNFHRGNIKSLIRIKRVLTRFAVWIFSVKKVACSVEAGKWLFGRSHEVHLLKNSFDINEYVFQSNMRADVRQELGVRDYEKLMIFVGRLEPQKSPIEAIQIFIACQNVGWDKMIVLGDGSLLGEVKAFISEKSLEDSVIMLGNVRDVKKYLFSADYFVAPSRHEGLGIAAVEAYITGLNLLISNAFPAEVASLDSTLVFSDDYSSSLISHDISYVMDERLTLSRYRLEQVRNLGYDAEKNELLTLYGEFSEL